MYTLTTRKSNPNRIELRYAETDKQVTLIQAELAPFVDTWLDVTETIKYGTSGSYQIEIKRLSDNVSLLSYANQEIINWRQGANFVRPKWGIYRSLINNQDLRDETISFANFSIEELGTLSVNDAEIKDDSFYIFPNPVGNILYVKNLPEKANLIQLFSLDGQQLMDKTIDSESEINIDVSSISNGSYFVILRGEQLYQSKLVIISH